MDPTHPLSPVNTQIIYDINGGLFFWSITMFMPTAMSVVLTFPAERAVFLREHSANMYGVSAYYFGRSTTEIPFVIFFPVLMTFVSYYIVGFNPDVSKFFIFSKLSFLKSTLSYLPSLKSAYFGTCCSCRQRNWAFCWKLL